MHADRYMQTKIENTYKLKIGYIDFRTSSVIDSNKIFRDINVEIDQSPNNQSKENLVCQVIFRYIHTHTHTYTHTHTHTHIYIYREREIDIHMGLTAPN